MKILPQIAVKVKRIAYFDDRFYDILFADGINDYFKSVTTVTGTYFKPGLFQWVKDVGGENADRISWEAKRRGSRVHKAMQVVSVGCPVWLEREDFEMQDPELALQAKAVREYCQKFQIPFYILHDQDEMEIINKWKRLYRLMNPVNDKGELTKQMYKILAREQVAYSLQHRYACTLDEESEYQEGAVIPNGQKPIIIPQTGIYITDDKTGGEYREHRLQISANAEAYEQLSGNPVLGTLLRYWDANIKTGEIPGLKVVFMPREEWKVELEQFLHLAAMFDYDHRDFKPKIRSFESMIHLPELFGTPWGFQTQDTVGLKALSETKVDGVGLTEDLQASLVQEQQKPKAEEKPKGIHSPDKNKKTPPAKANAQPGASSTVVQQSSDTLFDKGTTERYK